MSESIEKRASFDYVRYANCWEDADILIRALDTGKGKNFLSIGSAGDNSLALLLLKPELVVAVDLNPAQLACVELRKLAFKNLKYEEMLQFLGFKNALPEWRLSTFISFKNNLSPSAQNYFQTKLEHVKQGIIHFGKFEKYFGYFKNIVMPLVHSRSTIDELLAEKSHEQQREFYNKKWNTWRWKLLFKIFFSKAASPVLQGRMIALQGNSPQVFNLTAMRQEDVNSVSGVASTVIIGKFNLGIGDFPAVVLGAGLADRLRALPSDTITLVSPRMIESALASMSRPKGIKVIVSGIFQANAREYDNTVGYTSAQLGQQLLKAGEKDATSIDIRLHSINSVVAVQKSLQTSLPQNIIVETWYDLHKELYDVMQLERLASFVVLSLVIVVAVFNVLASLSMTVFEKRADIAMLKSMGASDNFIQRIYLLEGLSIGILGTLAGVVLGLALCFGQIHFGWIKLDTSKYILAALPLSVHFSDVIAVIIVTLLLSFLATIFPSKRAAQTQIAAALRRE